MIDALYITAEDALRSKKVSAKLTAGQPVALDTNGELIGATAGSAAVFGINKSDSNDYANYAYGEFGAFGTGKLTVVQKGTVRIKDSVYNEIEVDTQSSVSSVPVTIALLKSGITWAVGNMAYVDADGLITNVESGLAFGKVLATPAMTGGWLEIEVDALGLQA